MRTLFVLPLIAVCLVSAGCGRTKKEPDPAPVAQVAPKKDVPKVDPAKKDAPQEQFKKPPIRGGSVVRRIDEVDVMAMMKSLDLATKNFQAIANRYPNTREELEPLYDKNAKINEALKEGDVVYIWKARRAEEPEKAILAYEGQPDTSGRRVVLLANGDIKTINAEEFAAMAKMPTSK